MATMLDALISLPGVEFSKSVLSYSQMPFLQSLHSLCPNLPQQEKQVSTFWLQVDIQLDIYDRYNIKWLSSVLSEWVIVV